MITKSLYLRRLFILILVVGLPSCVGAQAHFQKLIGGEKYKVMGVQPTSDGGYIITGSKLIQPGIYDYSLIKTDSDGEPEWTKSYGYIYNDEPASVIQTSDSGYAVIGFSDISGGGAPSAYIVKTDAIGDTIWTRTYGTTNLDYGTSILEEQNGEYLISGYTWNTAGANFDPFIMKLNSNGDSLWSKIYRGPGDDKCQMVQKTSDNGYILVGASNSDGTGGYDYLLIKTDSTGTLQWSKTYGGAAMDIGFLVLENNNSGYLIGGWTKSFGAGTFEVYLVSVDMNGDQLWSKTYGGGLTDWPWSINATSDGGYMIVAETESFGAGGFDAYLIKIDSLGDTLWTKTYGGGQDDYLVNIDLRSPNEYILFGGSSSFGGFDESIYMVKTDGEGNSDCNEMSTQTVVTAPLTEVDTISFSTESGMGKSQRVTTVNVDSFVDTTLCYTCADPIALFEVVDSFLDISVNDSSLNTTSWTWDFGDGNSSTEQNPNHTYATQGSYLVCLTVANECGEDSICMNLDVTISVDEKGALAVIKVYPNPTSGLVELEIPNANIYSVLVFHVNGQLIISKDTKEATISSEVTLDLRTFPKGLYFVQILTDREVYTDKIIIQ